MPQIRFANRLDYMSRVALGIAPGHTIMSGIGERDTMGTSASGEDIWRGNELTPAPTSDISIPVPPAVGEQMSVVSESVNDTAAGTGARTVMIHYIDADGNDMEETLTLNGTTLVNTVATNIRFVNDFHVMTAGTGLVTAGHVKIHSQGDSGLVYNMIALGGNKSLVANRMVPAGHSLMVKNWHAGEAQGKRVAVRLRSTDIHNTLMPGVFLFKDVVYLNGNPSGDLSVNFVAPALSIIKVSGWPTAVGADVSCSWHGILLENK